MEEEREEENIKEVKTIANNLFQNIDGVDLEIFEYTKNINLNYLFGALTSLGSNFDGFIFESVAGETGKELVMKYLNNVFEQSEGAIIYVPGQNRKDINTAVFVNSEGNPTYEGKDLGLVKLKFDRYNPDFSFFVTDSEQGPHFKVVLDAAGR
jgi:arginyl-tRNA synthetase